MRLLPLLLLVPLVPAATAGLSIQQEATVEAAAGAPAVTVEAGDLGTATLGASATGATVALGSLPLLVADDFLRLHGGPAGWSVHAELVGRSGWTSLAADVTVSLSDGSTSANQVRVTNLGVLRSSGTPLAFTDGTPVELRVLGEGTGTLVLDLVLDPAAGLELRYRVTLTVG